LVILIINIKVSMILISHPCNLLNNFKKCIYFKLKYRKLRTVDKYLKVFSFALREKGRGGGAAGLEIIFLLLGPQPFMFKTLLRKRIHVTTHTP